LATRDPALFGQSLVTPLTIEKIDFIVEADQKRYAIECKGGNPNPKALFLKKIFQSD
jgi:hypothetical protein